MTRYDITIIEISEDKLVCEVEWTAYLRGNPANNGKFKVVMVDGRTSYDPICPSYHLPDINNCFSDSLRVYLSGWKKEPNYFIWDKYL